MQEKWNAWYSKISNHFCAKICNDSRKFYDYYESFIKSSLSGLLNIRLFPLLFHKRQ